GGHVGDVRVKEVSDIEPVDIASVSNIAPVTIDTVRRVENIAPVAVHIKELNQVDPLLVDSLRIDQIRALAPVNLDRLNITRLPLVNLSVNQVPNVDLSVGRLPPVSIGVHQVFDLPSQYMARARLFGFEVLRVQIEGRTRVIPRDCARREQA